MLGVPRAVRRGRTCLPPRPPSVPGNGAGLTPRKAHPHPVPRDTARRGPHKAKKKLHFPQKRTYSGGGPSFPRPGGCGATSGSASRGWKKFSGSKLWGREFPLQFFALRAKPLQGGEAGNKAAVNYRQPLRKPSV